MSKFKAGEKVITTKQGGWYGVGEVFTLTKPYFGENIAGWHTEEQGEGFFIHVENMKLLKLSPKDMLKNGMRVKLRNGLLYTYIDGYFTNIKTKKGGLYYLSKVDEWGDNLSYFTNGEECIWDVIEIFAATEIYDYFNYEIATESLWKRVEETESKKQLKILQEQIIS